MSPDLFFLKLSSIYKHLRNTVVQRAQFQLFILKVIDSGITDMSPLDIVLICQKYGQRRFHFFCPPLFLLFLQQQALTCFKTFF